MMFSTCLVFLLLALHVHAADSSHLMKSAAMLLDDLETACKGEPESCAQTAEQLATHLNDVQEIIANFVETNEELEKLAEINDKILPPLFVLHSPDTVDEYRKLYLEQIEDVVRRADELLMNMSSMEREQWLNVLSQQRHKHQNYEL